MRAANALAGGDGRYGGGTVTDHTVVSPHSKPSVRRHWREVWALADRDGQELDDRVLSLEELRVVIEELVAMGLLERFRRADGEIVYQCVESWIVN